MTPAHREEVEGLIGSLGDQIVGGVAKGRKLTPDRVRAAIDRGPLLDSEAIEAHLVDRLPQVPLEFADALRAARAGGVARTRARQARRDPAAVPDAPNPANVASRTTIRSPGSARLR